MTSKLKCPFCGQELIREGMNHWWCSCNIEHQGKELYGTTALWQALIRRTNQLNIAITDIHHAYKSLMGGCAEWRLYLEQTLKQIQDLDNEQ
jgi:hypothetical protein